MNAIKRTLKILFFIVAAYIVIYLVACFVDKDDAVAHDEAMAIVHKPLADADNGYWYVQEAGKKLIPLPKDSPLLNTEPQQANMAKIDKKLIADYVEGNREALQLAEKADQCELYLGPEIRGMDKDLFGFNSTIQLALLRAWKAHYLQSQGREKEALTEAFRIAQMGRKLQEAKFNLILYTVGTAVQRIGLQEVRDLATVNHLGNEAFSSYLKSDALFMTSRDGLKNAFIAEYHSGVAWYINLIFKTLADHHTQMKLQYRLFFKLNRTKTEAANLVEKLIAAIDAPFFSPERSEFNRLAKMKWSWFYCLVTTNPIGVKTAAASVYGSDQYLNSVDQTDSKNNELRILLALKSYWLKTGSLPGNLDALIPGYLNKIPNDSFHGEPIYYSKEKKMLWFSGANGIVDGSNKDDDFDQTTLKIPF